MVYRAVERYWDNGPDQWTNGPVAMETRVAEAVSVEGGQVLGKLCELQLKLKYQYPFCFEPSTFKQEYSIHQIQLTFKQIRANLNYVLHTWNVRIALQLLNKYASKCTRVRKKRTVSETKSEIIQDIVTVRECMRIKKPSGELRR